MINDRFLIRIGDGQKEYHSVFQMLKEKTCQTRILSCGLFFSSEGEEKTSLEKQKVREFVTSRPILK